MMTDKEMTQLVRDRGWKGMIRAVSEQVGVDVSDLTWKEMRLAMFIVETYGKDTLLKIAPSRIAEAGTKLRMKTQMEDNALEDVIPGIAAEIIAEMESANVSG